MNCHACGEEIIKGEGRLAVCLCGISMGEVSQVVIHKGCEDKQLKINTEAIREHVK